MDKGKQTELRESAKWWEMKQRAIWWPRWKWQTWRWEKAGGDNEKCMNPTRYLQARFERRREDGGSGCIIHCLDKNRVAKHRDKPAEKNKTWKGKAITGECERNIVSVWMKGISWFVIIIVTQNPVVVIFGVFNTWYHEQKQTASYQEPKVQQKNVQQILNIHWYHGYVQLYPLLGP